MKKGLIALICIALLMVGCSSISQGEIGFSQIFNVETSHFDQYTGEQTETAYVIKGRVSQENDENAVAAKIHAEENTTIRILGESAVYDVEIRFELTDGVSYTQ